MSARLPSWFWLLLCIASFAGSALAWRIERPTKASAMQPRAAAAEAPPSVVAADPTPAAAPNAALEAPPIGATSATPPRPAPATFAVLIPGDTSAATKVLRCVIRGRVTYVDAASTCADGSEGKVTLLPR